MAFGLPSLEDRAAWLGRIGEPGAHDSIASGSRILLDVDAIEAPVGSPGSHRGWLRVAAWNAERCRYLDASLELLARVDADVVLLSELDSGMARSGNHDVPRRLAEGLGLGGAFGVEFVELSIGDAADVVSADASGMTTNDRGLHGNAVLARGGVRDAAVLRLDEGGDWFTADRGQPRVGGRMAVAGVVTIAGDVDLTVVSFHLESRSTADERGAQFARLLAAVDDRFGSGPCVLGGDANTFGVAIAELADRAAVQRMRCEEPTRFSWPVGHEPLFEEAARRGFSWIDSNVVAPTTNHDAGGLPDHVPLHLDWLLTRGLEARRPAVVPAVDGRGSPLSDHELVAVSVRPST
ncbi:MAG TPA: endonuclease/exonuclease/phosphatase family protein [Acidimicrobiales bacterium]|nr:endonuclease/exonuclease/phosphatase family protein [Acidimicrobiales bacterium]